MADSRKDYKGRTLRNGETYDFNTGRYRYSYQDTNGKRCQVYSWTLTKNDKVPAGKSQKSGESLREKEIKIQAEIANGIDSQAGNMTVLQLLQKYIAIKSRDVRETTRNGYRTQLKFMQTNPRAKQMASKHIKDVDPLYAEMWL